MMQQRVLALQELVCLIVDCYLELFVHVVMSILILYAVYEYNVLTKYMYMLHGKDITIKRLRYQFELTF